jgi:hypothetical protein
MTARVSPNQPIPRDSKSARWSRWILPLLVLLTTLAASATASAHAGHDHAAPHFDGRVPGQPDLKRMGDTTYDFLPNKEIYKVTRPGEPPQFMHVDPPETITDPAVGDAGTGGQILLPTNELSPICRNWGNRIIINYDGPDPVPTTALRSAVRRMNWKIANQSSLTSGGTRTVSMAVECDAAGQIAIYDYSLAEAHVKFGSPQGANAIKVLTYEAGGISGAGSVFTSNVKSRENDSARYTGYGWMSKNPDGLGWQTHGPMHELFHTMGATQNYNVTPHAPYSTGLVERTAFIALTAGTSCVTKTMPVANGVPTPRHGARRAPATTLRAAFRSTVAPIPTLMQLQRQALISLTTGTLGNQRIHISVYRRPPNQVRQLGSQPFERRSQGFPPK